MLVNSGLIYWPDPSIVQPWTVTSGFPLFSVSANFTLDSTNTRQAVVMSVPKAGNITGVAFTLQSVTSAQDVRAALQTLDGSGLPSGTNYNGSAAGTLVSGSVAANVVLDLTLGTQATAAAAGDIVAVVFDWPGTAGTIRLATAQAGSISSYAYEMRFAAAAWSARAFTRAVVAFKYSDGSYASVTPLVSTTASRAFNASTAGSDEYGLKMTVPTICRCVGLYSLAGLATSTNKVAMLLYSGTSNIAAAVFDPDACLATASQIYPFYFASPVILTPGNTYYVSASPESTTANITLNCAQVPANGHFATWPGGAGVYQVKRNNAVTWTSGVPSFTSVAWTEVNTEYTPLGLILDQLDDGRKYRGRRGN